MTYAAEYTIWNKLVRDNVVSELEEKGIKASFTVIDSQHQLFVLLGKKLEEELAEFDEATMSNDIKKVLEEGADVQTVSDKLHTMITNIAVQNSESYFRVIENLGQAERKINVRIKQSGHDHLQKMQEILEAKLQTKGGFDKGIYLISTEG